MKLSQDVFEVIPDVMARARRAPCPSCGAPLQLAQAGHQTQCEYCDGSATLEYRLRKVEPSFEHAGPLQTEHAGAGSWLTLHGEVEDCACPGCGGTFQANTTQGILTCTFCSTQSKVESRLRDITLDDVEPPQRRNEVDAENQRNDRLDYPWDVPTEQLMWRVLNEPALGPRLVLADRLNRWNAINPTLAHFLPWLLEGLMRDEEAVAHVGAGVVTKMLCHKDTGYVLPVLQGARQPALVPNARTVLLFELSNGPPTCMKLLLDAAQAASERGETAVVTNALWGVTNTICRNFPAHPLMAEVLLYRLFYVSGPVLGWALEILGRRHSGLRGKYPAEILIRAIDDFGFERPELVPPLLDCLPETRAEDAAAYRARLALIQGASGWGGRAAAAEHLGVPPEHEDALYAEAVAVLEPLLDEPQVASSAERAVYALVYAHGAAAPALLDLANRRGERLSDRVKRLLINANPGLDERLTYARYASSDYARQIDPEVRSARDAWDALEDLEEPVWGRGRRELFDQRDAAVEEFDPPLYLSYEPETLQPRPEAPKSEPAPATAPVADPKQQLQAELFEVMEDYGKRMAGAAPMDSLRLMSEMQQAVAELQQRIAQLD